MEKAKEAIEKATKAALAEKERKKVYKALSVKKPAFKYRKLAAFSGGG